MKLYELLTDIEFQQEVHIVYYDYEKEERIETTREKADYNEVRYLYSEEDKIYIEVDNED